MTEHGADGYTGRRDSERLPPYAPPLPAAAGSAGLASDAADGPPVAAVAPAEPVATPEQVEEAAAFAEAQEQGVGDARWPAPEVDDAPPVPVEPLLVPGSEPDPMTEALPVASVDIEADESAPMVEPASTGIDPETGHLLSEPVTAEIERAVPGDAALPAETTADPLLVRAALLGAVAQASSSGSGTATALADPIAEPAVVAGSRRPGGFRDEPVRTTVRGLGELLITLGVILGLFVVYELYVTDLLGAQKQAAAKEQMEQQWAADDPTLAAPPADPTTSTGGQVVDPADRQRQYATVTGEGFANLYIPVFGADFVYAVVEGTTVDDLYGNPGHYDDTQYPGELGNFAVAGHRVSKGSPFNALDTLNSCDAIVIETQDTWFVYRVLPMGDEVAGWNAAAEAQCADVQPLTGEYDGVEGREIVDPSDYAQVLPIPHVNASGEAALAAATQRLITLTTCHPQFSDAQRMIIHGVLTKTYAKAPGFLPAELQES